MKILWVSARLIGPVKEIKKSDYKGISGSWIQTEYDEIVQNTTENKFYFLCGTREKNKNRYEMSKLKNKELFTIFLPRISLGVRSSNKFKKTIAEIIQKISPDIIHLWGTETIIHDAIIEASTNVPVVIYIQGLIGIHYRYKGGYILSSGVGYEKNLSFIDKISNKIRLYLFKKHIEIEKRILIKSKNIITDNEFTKAYCNSLSNGFKYYTKQLNANNIFRNYIWDPNKMNQHTIFTVYGGSPDKGLHQLLSAILIIRKKYPKITLRIPGPYNLDTYGSLRLSKKANPYEKWLYNFITKHNLRDNVIFLGPLNPDQMARNISECNVFVNPSIMEVHALSLREAMTVGAPCVTSICGSTLEFVKHKFNGLLYRYEEQEMLALLISYFFDNLDNTINIAKNGRNTMEKLFQSSLDNSLIDIYNSILKVKE